MVNQYNETVSRNVCILLNLESEGVLMQEDVIEQAISIAAGLAQMCIRDSMIRIILQWESIILCNIQGIMENGMTLCAITDIMVKVLRGLLRSIVGSIIWSR